MLISEVPTGNFKGRNAALEPGINMLSKSKGRRPPPASPGTRALSVAVFSWGGWQEYLMASCACIRSSGCRLCFVHPLTVKTSEKSGPVAEHADYGVTVISTGFLQLEVGARLVLTDSRGMQVEE